MIEPGGPPSSPPVVVFSLAGQQLALHEALAEKHPDLAVMYRGALLALLQEQNPERFTQAAHSLRELMEKLPTFAAVEMPAHGETLKQKVSGLKDQWQKAVRRTSCRHDGGWDGPVDAPLFELLRGMETFFEWFAQHMPHRRDEAGTLLRVIEVSQQPLPRPLAERNVDLWMDIREYFQAVAHHRQSDVSEFNQWQGAFELFLLDRLRPRTFADFDAIDAIVEAGEAGDA